MFSGIVQTKGPLQWINKSTTQGRLCIGLTPTMREGLQLGASVSVQGVCLTVADLEPNAAFFDVLAETLNRTSLGQLPTGAMVNLERALRMGDEIGGHLLSGHIITTAIIQNIETLTNNQRVLTLRADPHWMKYMLPKGYIALNGASLTLVDVMANGTFTVHLIPETLKITTFGEAQIDDTVNVEIDSQTQAIVDTVERVVAQQQMS